MIALIEENKCVAVSEKGFPSYKGSGIIVNAEASVGLGDAWDGATFTSGISKEDEYNWAKSEILTIPEQLRNCELKASYPNDERVKCIGTKADWEEYIIALKYYATVDADGNYDTRVDERPTRPTL